MTPSEHFFHRKPENYNCAQAVLKGWQEEFEIDEATIEEFRSWGGGRAEGGVCGALFATEFLLNNRQLACSPKEFVEQATSAHCQQIKQNLFPCKKCVKLADQLIKRAIN